jgi:hypothetical protein
MVTPQIGFAAGGRYQQSLGKIWSTSDGGQTWQLELTTTSEITQLQSTRSSTAYVDVFAAGVYADFHGGVWRRRIYLPQAGEPLVAAQPDTVDFGTRPLHHSDTLTCWLKNIGTGTDSLVGITGGTALLSAFWNYPALFPLAAGDSTELPILYRNDTLRGDFATTLIVNTRRTGRVEIVCRVHVPLSLEPHHAPMPENSSLTVWPNPGNALFRLRFELPVRQKVALEIYDLAGRLVDTIARGEYAAGSHETSWNAAAHASGIYFVRMEGATASRLQKILLIK